MNDDRWARVEELYHAALEHELEYRDAFLASACGDDSELRREVESLLSHNLDNSLFAEPAWAGAHEVQDVSTSTGALLSTGAVLGAYRIIGLIGSGGMGQVYRARDERLKRDVAIKILSPGQDVRRFEREARTVAAINHPCIVSVFDVGAERGIHWLVEELVDGHSLQTILRKGPLDLTRFRRLAVQIAEGLAAAHQVGIVHRDLKPANIMITRDGNAKILDFGLATYGVSQPDETAKMALTRDGWILGTSAYMSPEQVEGKTLDARSDIFSYGVLLYEMIIGRKAFVRPTPAATFAAVLHEQPQAIEEVVSDVPRELVKIIDRCLRKDPQRRYQAIDDVRIAIEEFDDETTLNLQNRPPGGARRLWLIAACSIRRAGCARLVLNVAFVQNPCEFGAPPTTIPFTSLPGVERYPNFSPDGDAIAFVWTDPAQNHSRIYVKYLVRAVFLGRAILAAAVFRSLLKKIP